MYYYVANTSFNINNTSFDMAVRRAAIAPWNTISMYVLIRLLTWRLEGRLLLLETRFGIRMYLLLRHQYVFWYGGRKGGIAPWNTIFMHVLLRQYAFWYDGWQGGHCSFQHDLYVCIIANHQYVLWYGGWKGGYWSHDFDACIITFVNLPKLVLL